MRKFRLALKNKFKAFGDQVNGTDNTECEDTATSSDEVSAMKSDESPQRPVSDAECDDVAAQDDVLKSEGLKSPTSWVRDISVDKLQEQLLCALIQNQELEQTVKEYERISELYNHEREKSKALEQQLRDFIKQTREAATRVKDDPDDEFVDIAQEMSESMELSNSNVARPSWRMRLNAWLSATFHELLRDLTDAPDVDEHVEEEQLAVKTLKTNITRFKEDAGPIFATIQGFNNLFAWQYPTSTALAFCIYMYAVWKGWLLPVTLFLILVRLSFNYLNTKGYVINLNFLTAYEAKAEERGANTFSEMGVSDKLTVVLQVATKVQNTLGFLADNLEKLWNLLLWKQGEATVQLYVVIWIAFILSCFVPGTMYFQLIGLYMGIKMFVIEFIYLRFPRFKQRHDSVYILWKNLPTNGQILKKLKRMENSSKSLEQEAEEKDAAVRIESDNEDKSFCDIFSLQYDEHPLPDWQDGKGCALIDKDKGIRHGFKYGKLFLTKSFLCYERHKKKSPKNITIPLVDVIEIKKVKPYSWIPGSGMSIEVTVYGLEKPYVFGAILSRDEVFDAILAHGLDAQLPWAKGSDESRHKVGTWGGSKESVQEEEEEAKDKGDDVVRKDDLNELRQRSYRMSDLKGEFDLN